MSPHPDSYSYGNQAYKLWVGFESPHHRFECNSSRNARYRRRERHENDR